MGIHRVKSKDTIILSVNALQVAIISWGTSVLSRWFGSGHVRWPTWSGTGHWPSHCPAPGEGEEGAGYWGAVINSSAELSFFSRHFSWLCCRYKTKADDNVWSGLIQARKDIGLLKVTRIMLKLYWMMFIWSKHFCMNENIDEVRMICICEWHSG